MLVRIQIDMVEVGNQVLKVLFWAGLIEFIEFVADRFIKFP